MMMSEHEQGICDYGDCEDTATCLVGYSRESRPMCAKHASRVMGWDARLRVQITYTEREKETGE